MNKYYIGLVASLMAFSGCEPQQKSPAERAEITKSALPIPAICNIVDVAGKTPKQVAAIYGKPDSPSPEIIHDRPCGGVGCPRFTYENGLLDIVYIKGKADWITIKPPMSCRFEAKSIELLGLKNTSPDQEALGAIRWNFKNDLREVSIFPTTSGSVDYIYVIWKTAL